MRPNRLNLVIGIFLLTALVATTVPSTARAQANDPYLGEFTVLMDNLIDKITTIESAFSPALAGSIARTRRLEVYSLHWPEIESMTTGVQARSDMNSLRISELLTLAETMDPTVPEFLTVLEELWVRATILQATSRGILSETVESYVRRESSTFVADRGNFEHPDFDATTLTAEDHVRIYYCGFGLIVLFNMDNGFNRALSIFLESTDLKGYFGNQIVFRAADYDMAGLPVIQAVLNDAGSTPQLREYYFTVLAGKLIGPAGQFGHELSPSSEWKSNVAQMAYDHVIIPDRLESREMLDFYGVDFGSNSLTPETLLGLTWPESETWIASLLSSDYFMENVAGLEAMRWVDMDLYADSAGVLFNLSEPLMSSTDFTLAVLAKETFDADARYTGMPYSDVRRTRLQNNIPHLCDLMNRALDHPGVAYLSSTAWLDIYAEGSLTDHLADCMPMVAQVVVSDWESYTLGMDVYLPEGEIDLISYFMPQNPAYFWLTSDAVRGFLDAELDTGEVNPFRVWTYVTYLETAIDSGIELDNDWQSTLVRLKSWADNAEALILGDDLRAKLDELLF